MKPQSALVLRNLRCSIHSQSQTLTSSRLSFKPTRTFHYSHNPFSTAPSSSSSAPTSRRPPISHPRPVSNEDTQTDFSILNVLGNTPPPTTAIDACLSDGFHFDNGMKIGGGDGCLLLAGEAFAWRPWEAGGSSEKGKMINKTARMLNTKDQWGVADEAWGALDLVWPRPDLLILGLGASNYPLNPATRRYLNSLGVRVDVLDTRNAAAQFNLLATERGVGSIAAGLVPIGWQGR